MALSPAAIAARAIRVDCERADARMPSSGFTTGGFHSSRCFSPLGAPLAVTAATGPPSSASACSRGLPMVAEHRMKRGETP